MIVSISLSLIVNGLRAEGISLFSDESESVDENAGFREISVEEAIQKFKTGEVLFADARPANHYAAGRIKGALNLPDSEFDEWIGDFFTETEPEREIIAYCDGEHWSLGRDLAEKLHLVGFENAYYLKNGLTRWHERSQPIESDLEVQE